MKTAFVQGSLLKDLFELYARCVYLQIGWQKHMYVFLFSGLCRNKCFLFFYKYFMLWCFFFCYSQFMDHGFYPCFMFNSQTYFTWLLLLLLFSVFVSRLLFTTFASEYKPLILMWSFSSLFLFQDLQSEIETHRVVYDRLDGTGRKLLGSLTSQEDAVMLQRRLDEMNHRWNHLKSKSIAIRYVKTDYYYPLVLCTLMC